MEIDGLVHLVFDNVSHELVEDGSLRSPIECSSLRYVALAALVLFAASFLVNCSLIFVFCWHQELRNAMNSFTFAIAVLNLFATIFSLPFVIVSSYECRWVFDQRGCTLSAFIMFFTGCSSIYLMTTIAIERFIIIYKPMSVRKINRTTCAGSIAFCLLISLVWSSFPVVGWSRYTLDDSMVTCSLEFHQRGPGFVSFNIALFGCVFFIPLALIIGINIKTLLLISRTNNLSIVTRNTYAYTKRMQNERKLTISAFVVVGGFLVSWAPYALLSMVKSFTHSVGMMPLASVCVALLAESSFLWVTLFYILTNTKILRKYQRGALSASGSMSHTNSLSRSNELASRLGSSFKMEGIK